MRDHDDESFVRIQFDLPKAKVQDLDRIARDAGITTRKELFNNALTLLDWAIRRRAEGLRIYVAREDGQPIRELSMPILDNVKINRGRRMICRGILGTFSRKN